MTSLCYTLYQAKLTKRRKKRSKNLYKRDQTFSHSQLFICDGLKILFPLELIFDLHYKHSKGRGNEVLKVFMFHLVWAKERKKIYYLWLLFAWLFFCVFYYVTNFYFYFHHIQYHTTAYPCTYMYVVMCGICLEDILNKLYYSRMKKKVNLFLSPNWPTEGECRDLIGHNLILNYKFDIGRQLWE